MAATRAPRRPGRYGVPRRRGRSHGQLLQKQQQQQEKPGIPGTQAGSEQDKKRGEVPPLGPVT